MRAAWRLALFALPALFAAACAPKPTEILVLVGSTSLGSPEHIDQVSAKVMDGKGVLRSSHDFTVAGWPISFGVRPADNHAAPVIIEVTGAKKGDPIVRRRVETVFVEKSTRFLEIDLELACSPPPVCKDGQTCIHGVCASDAVSDLPDVPPGTGTPWDAAVPVALDTGPRDGAELDLGSDAADAISTDDDASPEAHAADAADADAGAADADAGADAGPSDMGPTDGPAPNQDAAPPDGAPDGGNPGFATLSIVLSGDGRGTLTIVAGGVLSLCGPNPCPPQSHPIGTQVTISASPDGVSTFGSFNPSPGGPTNPTTFTLTQDTTVGAAFGLQNPQQPPLLWGHTAIYAPSTDRMIVFGGTDNIAYEPTIRFFAHPDQRPAATGAISAGMSPEGRHGHTAVYSPTFKQMIIHGGTGLAGWLQDVWVLENADGASPPFWRSVNVAGGPGTISGHVAAYNDGADTMLTLDAQGTLWYLNHATGRTAAPHWSMATTASVTGTAPQVSGASAYYDATADKLWVYGGNDQHSASTNLMYSLTGAFGPSPAWSPAIQPQGIPPDPSSLQVLTYDAITTSLLVWGGLRGTGAVSTPLTALGSLGAMNPSWAPVSTTSPAPTIRYGASAIMVSDFARQTLVLYGGVVSASATSEVDILDLMMTPAAWRF